MRFHESGNNPNVGREPRPMHEEAGWVGFLHASVPAEVQGQMKICPGLDCTLDQAHRRSASRLLSIRGASARSVHTVVLQTWALSLKWVFGRPAPPQKKLNSFPH